MEERDLITLDEFAAMIGHEDGRAIAGWVATDRPKRNPAPKPVDHKIEKGHARPLFDRDEVVAWIARRPGKGGRPRTEERS